MSIFAKLSMWLCFVLLSTSPSVFALPAPVITQILTSNEPSNPISHFSPPHHSQLASRSINHGWCGIHIHQVFGDENRRYPGDPRAGNLTATMYDANQQQIGFLNWTHFDYRHFDAAATVEMPSQLPAVMLMRFSGIGLISTGSHSVLPIRFAIGGDEWYSNDDVRCKVGKVDAKGYTPYPWYYFPRRWMIAAWRRDMDCGFAC